MVPSLPCISMSGYLALDCALIMVLSLVLCTYAIFLNISIANMFAHLCLQLRSRSCAALCERLCVKVSVEASVCKSVCV